MSESRESRLARLDYITEHVDDLRRRMQHLAEGLDTIGSWHAANAATDLRELAEGDCPECVGVPNILTELRDAQLELKTSQAKSQ